MAAPTIAAGLRQLLRAHMPFSSMVAEDIDFIIESVEIGYFAPDEVVLAPSGKVPSHCMIVKQGRVQGEAPDRKGIAFEAGVGDCFPVGALLAERPVTLAYRSVGDTFCLLLPRERFMALAQRSAPFLDFCKRRLGALLDLSRQQLQQTYASEASAERTMATPLAELMRGPPLTCAPDTPLREAFGRMHAAHVGSMLVVEPHQGGEKVTGILTRTDLIGRVILPEVPLATPVREVMTSNVLTLDADETAADATLLMAEHSIRHIPIVRKEGGVQRVAGVVSERDLFALQRLTVRQLAVAIRRAEDVDSIAVAAADVRRLSHHLVAQGVSAAQLTRLISHLNDQLTVRLLTIGIQRFNLDARSFCWLSFGSGGRGEQTIATDQDNGILFVDGKTTKERMLELADWSNEALAACGFPLCKGNIMARNPAWCLDYAGWDALFSGWIDRGDPDALLNASIFFDFRPLFGDAGLANGLREDVVARAQRNPRFLKQMADNALRNRPPAGRGIVDSLFGEGGPARVDLKMHGTVPFVDAARIWALAAGLHETNTAERLLRLSEAGRLPDEDVRAWVPSFEYFQLMRLRAQHRRAQSYAGAADNPNEVALGDLSALDRRIINEAFRQARKVQQRLELDFPG
jgi:CBS domain-containing protein